MSVGAGYLDNQIMLGKYPQNIKQYGYDHIAIKQRPYGAHEWIFGEIQGGPIEMDQITGYDGAVKIWRGTAPFPGYDRAGLIQVKIWMSIDHSFLLKVNDQ